MPRSRWLGLSLFLPVILGCAAPPAATPEAPVLPAAEEAAPSRRALPVVAMAFSYPPGSSGPAVELAADGRVLADGTVVARVEDGRVVDASGVALATVASDGTIESRAFPRGARFAGDVLVSGGGDRITVSTTGEVRATLDRTFGSAPLGRFDHGATAPRTAALLAVLILRRDEAPAAEASADGESGVIGGVEGGPEPVGSGPPPPPPPPPPRAGVPPKVAPSALEPLRIAGARDVAPDAAALAAARAAGKARLVTSAVVCVDRSGSVDSTRIVKWSDVDVYDRAVLQAVSAWRFRPFLISGRPSAVCTAVTFRADVPPAAP
jgi:TonB family protein